GLRRRLTLELNYRSQPLLLETEEREVSKAIDRLVGVAARLARDELAVVVVVPSGDRGGVLHDRRGQRPVGAETLRPEEPGRRIHLAVVLRVVEVRVVVVVRIVNRLSAEENVHEVERVRVVRDPTDVADVERLGLRTALLVHGSGAELADADVDADLLQVGLDERALVDTDRARRGVHDRVPAPASSKLLRLREVGAEREDARVLVPAQVRREKLIGWVARIGATEVDHALPVERVVHGLSQFGVPEEPLVVETQIARRDYRMDEVPLLVDAVLLRQPRVCRRWQAAHVVVDLPTLDLGEAGVDVRVDGDDADRTRIVRTRAFVKLVPLDQDRTAGRAGRNVVRTRAGERVDALRGDRRCAFLPRSRNRAEEEHGHPRKDVRAGLREADRQRQTLRLDPADRRLRVALSVRRTDDVAEERNCRRLHLRVRVTVESSLVALRRDRDTVRELHPAANLEGV